MTWKAQRIFIKNNLCPCSKKKTYNFEILHLEWILEITVPFFHCICQCSLFTKGIKKFYILETACLRNGCSFGSCDRNILVCGISQSEYLWVWSALWRIMSWLIIYVMWLLSDVNSFNYLHFISFLEIPSQGIFNFSSK